MYVSMHARTNAQMDSQKHYATGGPQNEQQRHE